MLGNELIFIRPRDLFYPYGNATDQELPKEDDIGIEVHIARDFPYFDSNHRSLFVNDNGILSFNKLVEAYEADPFPLDDNRRLIAPYWADVDLSKGTGSVFYREITNDEEVFDRATKEVLRVFGGELGLKKFTTKWIFIATWENVPYFYLTGVGDRYNTFQTVLITDGVLSFVMFNYGQLEWTTGLSSGGEDGLAKGNKSVAAQVGFNAGDGVNFYSVVGSRTNQILNINRTSNVDRIGRWMFRVDLTDIVAGGCYDDIDDDRLSISPRVGSLLGGEVLYISGPCFDETKSIKCRIDGVVTSTSYKQHSPFTVECVTPMLLKVGDISVALSIDGGNTFPYTGSIHIVSLDIIRPPITFTSSGDTLDISWPVGNFPYFYSTAEDIRVDLNMYTYQEGNSNRRSIGGDIRLEKLVTVVSDIALTTAGYELDLASLPVEGKDVGLLQIVEHSVAPSIDVQPSMWSLPFNLNPSNSDSATTWCNEWARTAEGVNPTDDTPPCPCTLQQAIADTTWYEDDPFCNKGSQLERNCKNRPDAVHCVRARLPSTNGNGNQCCYSVDGYILHLEDFSSGGSHQLYHHAGASPYDLVGDIPFLSNYLWDVIPWNQCCVRSSSHSSCQAYLNKRPSDQCLDYNTPEPASIFGEPHIITFDDARLAFNELGEFVLMQLTSASELTSATEFEIQGRLQPFNKTATEPGTVGTALTAFAVYYAKSTTYIQVVLSERRTMDLMVWEEGQMTEWQLIDFAAGSWWRLNGVTVSSTTPSEILIQYDNGISAQVRVHSNSTAMALLVLAPESFKMRTTGLLGSWNDNPEDDNVSSTEFVVAASNSFFHYEALANYTTYNQPGFVPISTLPSTIPEEQVNLLCGNSMACAYDYQKTGDPNVAKGTKDAEEDYDNTDDSTEDVSVCPRLDAPVDGTKIGTVYIYGMSVSFTCREGSTLVGSESRTCINGAWSGNATSCEGPEPDKITKTNIILPLVIAAGALFGIISIIILIMICRIRRNRKKKETIEMDPTHERGPSNIPNPGYDDFDETPPEERKNVVQITPGGDPEYTKLDDHKKKGIDNDYMSIRNGARLLNGYDYPDEKKESKKHVDTDSEAEDEIAAIKKHFKAERELQM
ncbi:sushi domain-containing protein 2-like isoform X2 [Anneissia japonica]|uniref:sushi domain-containing protein 2-like isoform X2 n=1 Tax=Anneissia japonica TaxID=1529436 RepID=UPI001425A46F|nr:sushi domain-containing protein 2-like isoform X2 [Anneissia japonica]